MATSVMQIRIDDELRAQAAEVFEQLGIDIPTAVRMFLKRAVLENGIADMTLDEINAEIQEVRKSGGIQ